MRASRRVLAAAVLALALHVVVGERLVRVSVRERPRVDERITFELAAPPKPPAPVPAVEVPAEPRRTARSSPRARAPEEAAPDAPEPVVEAPRAPLVDNAPPGPSGPRQERSLLDPEVIDPSYNDEPAKDARARRLIEGVARVDAPPRPGPDAGRPSVVVELRKNDDGSFSYATGGFTARIAVDGTVSFKDNFMGGKLGAGKDGAPITNPRMDPSAPLTTVEFDPTALLLKAQGQDPYESEKVCFLEDTEELRADLREKHERNQLVTLRRALEDTWFDDGGTLAERHARLFELWDECREEAVGLEARQLVESFVRQHMPQGSANAFTDAELASLNAKRTSSMEFRPYG